MRDPINAFVPVRALPSRGRGPVAARPDLRGERPVRRGGLPTRGGNHLCLPIMRSERTDDEDRGATKRMRYARLSALADGAEDPCPAQGACAIYCNRRKWLSLNTTT